MSDKYKDTFRVLMIDQHFPDAPYITFSRFDAADQVRRCKDAAIDSLHVTTKCHWGHSYYRTETGLMHPALKGRDMVGELVAESRRAGIEAIAYYCILFENLAARNHRDWRFITKEGKPAIRNELFGATGSPRLRPGTSSTDCSWTFSRSAPISASTCVIALRAWRAMPNAAWIRTATIRR